MGTCRYVWRWVGSLSADRATSADRGGGGGGGDHAWGHAGMDQLTGQPVLIGGTMGTCRYGGGWGHYQLTGQPVLIGGTMGTLVWRCQLTGQPVLMGGGGPWGHAGMGSLVISRATQLDSTLRKAGSSFSMGNANGKSDC